MARTATASKRSGGRTSNTGSGRKKTGSTKSKASTGGSTRKRTTSRAGGSSSTTRKKTTARKTGATGRKTSSSTRSKRSTARSSSRKTTSKKTTTAKKTSTARVSSSRGKTSAKKTTTQRTRGTATGRTRKDALSILQSDHRMVEQLFRQYEQAGQAQKLELCRQICLELTIHAEIEEQHLYPEANRRITGEQDLVEEAYEEHDEAKQLIERLETIETGPEMDQLMKKLKDSVTHHVQEEEDEMFPKIREHFESKELTSIGRQMEQMKNQLQQQDEMAGV